MGGITEAQNWLQRALTDIDAHRMELKRPRAEKLATQL